MIRYVSNIHLCIALVMMFGCNNNSDIESTNKVHAIDVKNDTPAKQFDVTKAVYDTPGTIYKNVTVSMRIFDDRNQYLKPDVPVHFVVMNPATHLPKIKLHKGEVIDFNDSQDDIVS